MEFKERFEELLQYNGITAYRLSIETKISQGLISDYRNGRSRPSQKNIAKLADCFGVTSDYLLGRTDDPTTPKDAGDITFDDFTYAMHNEGKELTEAEREMLLDMARLLKAKHKEREKDGKASGTV